MMTNHGRRPRTDQDQGQDQVQDQEQNGQLEQNQDEDQVTNRTRAGIVLLLLSPAAETDEPVGELVAVEPTS